MHRVDGPGNVAGHWVAEDPENNIPGTQITAEIMETLQEEIAAVVESRGKVLNKANNSQLLESIMEIASGADLIARYATTGNIMLNGDAVQAGGDWPAPLPNATIVLVRAQTIPQDNGPYVVNATGAWSRLNTFDSSAEIIPGKTIKVTEGVTLADSIWMLTTDAPIVLNSTALNFERKDAASGNEASVNKSGFTLSNNLADVVNDIDIAPGKVRDYSDTYDIVLSAVLTKRLDASWVAGTNQGGLFSGAKAAGTWYHFFIIKNILTGVVDAGFDTSITAANRPANHTYKYINSIQTDSGSSIRQFVNVGLDMFLLSGVRDVSVTGVAANTTTNYTITTPPGIRTIAKIHAFSSGADTGLFVYQTDQPTVAVTFAYNTYIGGDIGIASATDYSASYLEVLTNTSSQIKTTTLQANAVDIAIVCYGWRLPNN